MKREYLFGLTTLLICALITAAGIEGYVRLFIDRGMEFDLEMFKYARDVKVISPDPVIGHVHGPNRKAHLMGVDIATNSKGLRDREIPYERSPGTLRVVMLGDSSTLGWGVLPEQTYSKLLEGMFAEKGIKAEVINTGVGNFKAFQKIEYFLTEAYKYNPDFVVVASAPNDAEDLAATSRAERIRPQLSFLRIHRRPFRHATPALLRAAGVERVLSWPLSGRQGAGVA